MSKSHRIVGSETQHLCPSWAVTHKQQARSFVWAARCHRWWLLGEKNQEMLKTSARTVKRRGAIWGWDDELRALSVLQQDRVKGWQRRKGNTGLAENPASFSSLFEYVNRMIWKFSWLHNSCFQQMNPQALLQTNPAAITAVTSQGANGVTIKWQFLVPDLQSDWYRQILVGKIKLWARARVSLGEWMRSRHQRGECVDLSAVCSMTEAAARKGNFHSRVTFLPAKSNQRADDSWVRIYPGCFWNSPLAGPTATYTCPLCWWGSQMQTCGSKPARLLVRL